MLKNFFRTAIRNMLRYRAYSLINFSGLTCGLALSLLILSYIRHELSFDRFHEKADRLYRLSYTVPNGLRLASTPPPIAPLMATFFPEVERTARVYGRNITIARADAPNGESFEETDVLFADSALVNMMDFEFVAGDRAGALKEPYSLMITEEMAKKYFGGKDPIGASLLLGGNHPFKVASVVKNFPQNSHIRFHMIAPWENMYDLEQDASREIIRRNLASNFVISHSYTYVLLKPGSSPKEVDAAMPAFLKKYCPPNRMIGQTFTLFPVVDIHLKSDMGAEPTPVSSMSNLIIFGAIGVLTLVIACINYINLSTAQSFTRIREIGIRKILGSGKRELIVQFLAESFLFCIISLVIAFAVFYAVLPTLSTLTGSTIEFGAVADLFLVISSITVVIIVTFLAGGYPAWFVSCFDSVSALKGNQHAGAGGSQYLRRALVIFQLTIACMLLSGSVLLVRQLDYITSRPLGFQKDHIITLQLFSQNLNSVFSRADSSARLRMQTFRDRAETLSNVEATTMSSASPGLGAIYRGTIPEGFTREDNLFIEDLCVDYDFIPTFGIKMVAGRAFDKNFGTDEATGFLVNEAAVREFHWNSSEQALGKTIDREGKKGKVIGVVADFNMQSLTTAIGPLLIEINPDQWNAVSVKIKNEDFKSSIEQLRKEWNTLFPEKTFEFTFLDEQLNQQYLAFINFGEMISIFAFIAIVICCLGVYGLVLFVVQRKVKEIGVRKVMGASAGNILILIFREFAVMIAVGFILATPAAVWFIDQWLKNFQFHINIDLLPFAFSFVVITVIVAITISYHAVKAALANPVKSLRSE